MGIITDWENIFSFMEYMDINAEFVLCEERGVVAENAIITGGYNEIMPLFYGAGIKEDMAVRRDKRMEEVSKSYFSRMEKKYVWEDGANELMKTRLHEIDVARAEKMREKVWMWNGDRLKDAKEERELFEKTTYEILPMVENKETWDMLEEKNRLWENMIKESMGEDEDLSYREAAGEIISNRVFENIAHNYSENMLMPKKDDVMEKVEKSRVKKLLEYVHVGKSEHGKDIKFELNNVNNITNSADIENVTELLTQRLCDLMQKSADGFYM